MKQNQKSGGSRKIGRSARKPSHAKYNATHAVKGKKVQRNKKRKASTKAHRFQTRARKGKVNPEHFTKEAKFRFVEVTDLIGAGGAKCKALLNK